MVAVSGVLIFLGYQLTAYGWSQVRGQNAGFFDILWPGRYKGNTPDSAASASTISYGSGVTSLLGQGVSKGIISQQTAQQDASGNATVSLGPGTFRAIKNAPPQAAP